MGAKGEKASDAGNEAAEALLDDLQALSGLSTKKMFGGNGVFGDGVMFAMVDTAGRCYFRADDETSRRYERAGSERHGKMPYWEIPAEVRADHASLLEHASIALGEARAAKK